MSALGPCRGVNANKPAWLFQMEREDATSGSGVGLDHDAVGERTNRGGWGGSLGGGVVDDAYNDGRYAGGTPTPTAAARSGISSAVSWGGGGAEDRTPPTSTGGEGGGVATTAGGTSVVGPWSSDRLIPSSAVYFWSYKEERDWVDDRRRARRSRRTKFDVEPTPEQLAEDEARAALEASHAVGGGMEPRGWRRVAEEEGGGQGPRSSDRLVLSSTIYLRSYEEERDWVDNRRRARRLRRTKFDVEPTPEQLAEDEARVALEASHTVEMWVGGLAAGVTPKVLQGYQCKWDALILSKGFQGYQCKWDD
ncbi:hypothetical protein ACHAW5_009026 [Stephanodiscus triporus]|uniref:Uncharacterized protein n=1 Tax=Stephanodiscus triporus TaxID=2934178 RepID=A0ABD3QM63_9STRA